MKRYKIFILSSILCISSVLVAQTKQFGFEDDQNKWTTKDSTLWEISSEKAKTGVTSLKYKVPENSQNSSTALLSFDTKHTIMLVRTAEIETKDYVIASSYEGIVMAVGYDGIIRWKTNVGNGIMNHDMWCDDLDGDGSDETLVANANGTLYCLGRDGKEKWTFSPGPTPMYAVTTIAKDGVKYVVCGATAMSYYYLNPSGNLVKEIKSKTYSIENVYSQFDAVLPPANTSNTNFLRPLKKADGNMVLAMAGNNNRNNDKGTLYLFEPLADLPYVKKGLDETVAVSGDCRTFDIDNDGVDEIILGPSHHKNDVSFSVYDQEANSITPHRIEGKFNSGYFITHTARIPNGSSYQILALAGNQIRIFNPDLDTKNDERLISTYAYNDLWQDKNQRIILASAQSGGSCIHIIDTKNNEWKTAYENLVPPGKISTLLANTQILRDKLQSYAHSDSLNKSRQVVFMTDSWNTPVALNTYNDIKANYTNPIFLNDVFYPHNESPESWSRDTISNEKYRVKRDKRRFYDVTQQQVLDVLEPEYEGYPGISKWGGHGNDPFYYSPQTILKILDLHPEKKTVLVYPEVGDHTDDFYYVMDVLFDPTIKYIQNNKCDAKLYMRYKQTYWQGTVYLPFWEKLISGEYADVIVPALEETSSKVMDMSIAGRMGLWASGCVNEFGNRCVMDNPCFDRLRQYGYQRLPNPFLRNYIYAIANGATYINNFTVDNDYLSFLWELIAKGALYVPKSNEILSISPVHLSIIHPDEDYLEWSSNSKWTTFYNKEYNHNNKFVFGRLNGTWVGSPVTEWDFSRYASGVKDRRQNFLPPYPHGMVLITPPQTGVNAEADAPRGKLTDHLHPIYKNNMKEYFTDGRNYYSADGTQTYAPEEYYKTIEADLIANEKKMPVVVKGDQVAWVVAQIAPKTLRITLIDGGYLNPDERRATISFNGVVPTKMKDVLDGKNFDISNPSSVRVDIPLGMFRFIDVEIEEAL